MCDTSNSVLAQTGLCLGKEPPQNKFEIYIPNLAKG